MITSTLLSSVQCGSLVRKIYSWSMDNDDSSCGSIPTSFTSILHCSHNINTVFDPLSSVGILRTTIDGTAIAFTGVDNGLSGTIEIVGTVQE